MEEVGGTGNYGEGKVALAKKKMTTKAEIKAERIREELEGFDKKLEKTLKVMRKMDSGPPLR